MLRLAASLLRDGLTVFIDQNRSADDENIPWRIWMENRIEEADNILLVCTELHWNKVRQKVPNDVGHGVCWEANLIYNSLYRDKLNTTKFVAVVFTSAERDFIPRPLQGATHFLLDSPSGYKRLFAFLSGQHRLRFPKQCPQLPVIAEEIVEPLFPTPEAIRVHVRSLQVASRRGTNPILRRFRGSLRKRKRPPISSRARQHCGRGSHFY